jgi:hypothetical protein
LIAEILELAGNIVKNNKTEPASIEPHHILEAISNDHELAQFFSSAVFAEANLVQENSDSRGHFDGFSDGFPGWGFCFKEGVKLQRGVEDMLFKISSNLVINIANNTIPFLVAHKVYFSFMANLTI